MINSDNFDRAMALTNDRLQKDFKWINRHRSLRQIYLLGAFNGLSCLVDEDVLSDKRIDLLSKVLMCVDDEDDFVRYPVANQFRSLRQEPTVEEGVYQIGPASVLLAEIEKDFAELDAMWAAAKTSRAGITRELCELEERLEATDDPDVQRQLSDQILRLIQGLEQVHRFFTLCRGSHSFLSRINGDN